MTVSSSWVGFHSPKIFRPRPYSCSSEGAGLQPSESFPPTRRHSGATSPRRHSGATSLRRHSGAARISVFAHALAVACSLFVIPHPERSRRGRNLLLPLPLLLLFGGSRGLQAPETIPSKNRASAPGLCPCFAGCPIHRSFIAMCGLLSTTPTALLSPPHSPSPPSAESPACPLCWTSGPESQCARRVVRLADRSAARCGMAPE